MAHFYFVIVTSLGAATALAGGACDDDDVDLGVWEKEQKRDELAREIDARRGRVVLWVDHDPRCGNVEVELGGLRDTIYSVAVGGPDGCDNGVGVATFEVRPGEHTYTAECSAYRWTGKVSVRDDDCTLQPLTVAQRQAREDAELAELVFWVREELACGDVEVTVDDTLSASITDPPWLTADCGDEGLANFELRFGTHHYRARCGSHTWNNTLELEAGRCHEIELTGAEPAEPPTDWTKGQAMFWTPHDLGCFPITVALAGQSGTITEIFPDGVPECRATGTATFDLDQGSYPYVATCGDKRWEGEVDVSPPFCFGWQLE